MERRNLLIEIMNLLNVLTKITKQDLVLLGLCKELIYYGGKNFGSKSIDKFNKISNLKYHSKNKICRVIASKSHLNNKTKDFIKTLICRLNLSKRVRS